MVGSAVACKQRKTFSGETYAHTEHDFNIDRKTQFSIHIYVATALGALAYFRSAYLFRFEGFGRATFLQLVRGSNPRRDVFVSNSARLAGSIWVF